MRVCIACVAMLLSAMGVVTDAVAVSENNADVAGKRGLSTIIDATMTDAGPSILAAAPVTAQAKYDAVFSICESMVPVGHSDFSALNNVTIDGAAMVYSHARGITLNEREPSVITLLEGPQHGEIQSIFYYPNKGYLGPDQMTYSLEVKGKIFKIIYSVYVNRSSEYVAPECGNNYNIKELPDNTYNGGKGSG